MEIEKISYAFMVPSMKKNHDSIVYKNVDIEYYATRDDEVEAGKYPQFPIIVNDDESQWLDANRFMLWKARLNPDIDHKTLYGIAHALKDFRCFCDDEEIDYLVMPTKYLRPPWQYRKYLLSEVKMGNLMHSTIRGRLSAVASFYEWLIDVEGVEFKYALWREERVRIWFTNGYGGMSSKIVTTKDLSRVRVAVNTADDADYIADGGRLKPLEPEEQDALLKVLMELDNPEMFYGFLIAVLTGARMQTVFTLRLRHFNQEALGDQEVKVTVGPGTLCDTKGGRVYKLHFPSWLYRRIKVYMASPRADKRRSRARVYGDDPEQYLFLTKYGNPFYTSKDDLKDEKFDKPIAGGSVRQFLYSEIISRINEGGMNVRFAFHDLRATYATNFLFGDTEEIDSSVDMRKRLEQLRVRMGLAGTFIAERYARYKMAPIEKAKIQNSFEQKMRRLLDEN